MATFLKSLRNLRHSHACVSIARSASLLATARQTAASTAKTSSLKRIAALSTTTAPRAGGDAGKGNTNAGSKSRRLTKGTAALLPDDVPGLAEFMRSSTVGEASGVVDAGESAELPPYLSPSMLSGAGKQVYFETYGCQMNVNDTEIAWALLLEAGYERTEELSDADVVMLMTCAIRDGAEQRVFKRLEEIRNINRKKYTKRAAKRLIAAGITPREGPKIGVLGCMAERLKTKLLEDDRGVDVVAGPDAYRDLPRLLADVHGSDTNSAINVQLSLDETYGDVAPMRLHPDRPSVFISIMRGCDNMCSYCIVPFTRGRERSRDVTSILKEVEKAAEQGYREVTLLGQNVNSYRHLVTPEKELIKSGGGGGGSAEQQATLNSEGFTTLYTPKMGGVRFADLIEQVSHVDPNMRVRFTSPHPKDFPDELLRVINDRPNVCKQIHMPAQSGSTSVLAAMRRGYTRESYIELVDHIRTSVPGVSLSSDFITGFCGETEQDHQDTLDLLEYVQYDQAFLYAYSMREKTNAHRKLVDDVPEATKKQRLAEAIRMFEIGAAAANQARVGRTEIVLVDGTSRRSSTELIGRSDGNIKIIFPDSVPSLSSSSSSGGGGGGSGGGGSGGGGGGIVRPAVGSYVEVRVDSSTSRTLRGTPLRMVTALEHAGRATVADAAATAATGMA